MAAAAALAARAEVFLGGNAPKFQSPVDVARDGLFNLVEFLLGINKPAGNGVAQEGIALLFECGDFVLAQGHRSLLLVLQFLTLVHERFVLRSGIAVSHEGVNASSDGTHVGAVHNRLAKFQGLGHYGRFFS